MAKNIARHGKTAWLGGDTTLSDRDFGPIPNFPRPRGRVANGEAMRREGAAHQRASADHALLADLDPPEHGAVRCNPTMIADRDAFYSLLTDRVEIMLIRIKYAGTGPNPNTLADLEKILRTQMAAIQKALFPDPNACSGKGEDQNRPEIGSKPGIGADLHFCAFGDRDMKAPISPLGIHARTDPKLRSWREREMRRSQVRAGLGINGQTGIPRMQAPKAKAIKSLDRLETPHRRSRRFRSRERRRRVSR